MLYHYKYYLVLSIIALYIAHTLPTENSSPPTVSVPYPCGANGFNYKSRYNLLGKRQGHRRKKLFLDLTSYPLVLPPCVNNSQHACQPKPLKLDDVIKTHTRLSPTDVQHILDYTAPPKQFIKAYASPVAALTYCRHTQQLAAATRDATLKIWNLQTEKPEFFEYWTFGKNNIENPTPPCIIFSGSGESIITIFHNNMQMRQFMVDNRETITHPKTLTLYNFVSANTTRFIYGEDWFDKGEDAIYYMQPTNGPQYSMIPIILQEAFEEAVTALACPHNDGYLTLGQKGGILSFWQIILYPQGTRVVAQTKKSFKTSLEIDTKHHEEITRLQFSPSTEYLIIGTSQGSVILWCMKKHTSVGKLSAHTTPITTLSFFERCDDSEDMLLSHSGEPEWLALVWSLQKRTLLYRFAEVTAAVPLSGCRVALGDALGEITLSSLHEHKDKKKNTTNISDFARDQHRQ